MSDALGLPLVLAFAAILLVVRIPIGIVLLFAGALGFSLVRGPIITMDTIGARLFDIGSGYALSAIPLFLLRADLDQRRFGVEQLCPGRYGPGHHSD